MSNEQVALELTKYYIRDRKLTIQATVDLYYEFLYFVQKHLEESAI